MSLLVLNNLGKKYGDKWSLNGFNLELEKGQIVGLLGPNGAGKTTMIRILTQISLPDTGEVLLGGQQLNGKDRAAFGYMPEERGLYPKMTVKDQLVYFAQLRGLSYVKAREVTKNWLAKFAILDWQNKKTMDLSKGMQQKIQFIVSVIHDPEIIILDEPLSGLDPINSELINQQILEFKQQNKTVIFSTHRMEQAEQICDKVVMINQGQKVLEGDVASLQKQHRLGLYQFQALNYNKMLEILTAQSIEIVDTDPSKKLFKCRISDLRNLSGTLQKLLVEAELQGFGEILPTLNEIFLKYV